MKKLLSVLLAVLMLVSLLTACGSSSKSSEESWSSIADYSYDSATAAAEYPAEEEWIGYSYENGSDAADSGSTEVSQDQTAASADKIIYSADISLETTEFDKAIAALESMVSTYGGYIQSSSVNGYTSYNEDGSTTVVDRYACYTIAVPSSSFQAAMTSAGTIGNVTSKHQDAENITSQYTDTEARIDSLKTQQERILELMEQAEDVEDLITLEERLSDITYELESYQRQLNNFDRQVAYSTITFYVQEVEAYTPTASVTRTFGEKMSDAFRDGWTGFVRAIQSFILWFVAALPSLILLAVIATAIVLIVKKLRKKHTARSAAAQPENK